jgi:transposase-like protein
MSYDRITIAHAAVAMALSTPGVSETAIATALGVDRHTLSRSLGSIGLSFTQLRGLAMYQMLDALSTNGRTTSWKEVAAHIGCSTATLTRWRQKHRASSRPRVGALPLGTRRQR